MLFYLEAETEKGHKCEASIEVNNEAVRNSVVPYYEVNQTVKEGVEKLIDELDGNKETIVSMRVWRTK